MKRRFRGQEEVDELMRRFESMPEDTERLVGLLSDENRLVREAAIMRLVRLSEKVGDDVLIDALGNDAPKVRGLAAMELGKRKCRAAASALLRLLASDQSADVRAFSAMALSRIGGRAALDGLLAALDDENSSVRHTACWAFRRRKNRRAVPRMRPMLSDPDFYVRLCVAETLVSLGIADDRLVETTEQLLSDPVLLKNEAGQREGEVEIRAFLGDPEELRRHAETTGQSIGELRDCLRYALRRLQKEDFMSRSRLERLAERARELASGQEP